MKQSAIFMIVEPLMISLFISITIEIKLDMGINETVDKYLQKRYLALSQKMKNHCQLELHC